MDPTTPSRDPRCGSPTLPRLRSSSCVLLSLQLRLQDAHHSRSAQVFANCDPSKGYKGISCFLVEKEMGIEIAKKEKKVRFASFSTQIRSS